MNKKVRLFVLSVLAVPLAFFMLKSASGQSSSATRRPANNILRRALDIELGRVQARVNEPRVSSGVIYTLLMSSGEMQRRVAAVGALAPNLAAAAPLPNLGAKTAGCSNVFTNSNGTMRNVRVNQDCSLRRQAEEVVVINPTNPQNLIAGQNDSRIGFNKCGYDFSFNGGRTWGDQLPPFYQFVNLDGVTYDACSDPTATFDSNGNAYIGGLVFEISLPDSGVLVEKSNAPIGGAFYHSPQPGPFQLYVDNPPGVVTNDNNPNVSNDKEFIVADNNPSSPHANNVYATWTRFTATGVGVGGDSPIYFSQSTDGGATWSQGIEITGANAAICTVGSGETNPNACDQDQGSHPIVGPDGTVYVAFGNGNTPLNGINQHLIVSCSANCNLAGSWSAPVKISDDFGTQPVGPNAATGCSPGRQCLPPNGYRLDDFVEGSLSIDNAGTLYFVWADFRNGGGTCTPLGPAATVTPPCNNDVFYSFSTDHGATWSAAFNVTPASKFGPTAQWQPWSAVTLDGERLWIAYYDRSYGNCEFTGCNDITAAEVHRPASNRPSVNYTRVTTSSMPNLVVANNPAQAGFLGDYMWVTVDNRGRANVVWADTRGLNQTVEEDIYFAVVGGEN
jgi:hypothetical protein